MAKVKKQKNEAKDQSIEQVLWAAADKLRKNMDAAEYKHVVLGLIFLKYILEMGRVRWESSTLTYLRKVTHVVS